MKVLRVTMPDGAVYEVPALLIAESRAVYYIAGDISRGDATPEEREHLVAEEVRLTLTDELIDWASNNMDWCDVKEHAVRLPAQPPEPCDYNRAWTNAAKRVVEAPEKDAAQIVPAAAEAPFADEVARLRAALDEVYADRNRLVMLAAVMANEAGFDAGLIDDPAEPDWPVVAIVLPSDQVSWHVPRALLRGTEAHWPVMTWDGHTNEQKAERIIEYVFDPNEWPMYTEDEAAQQGAASDDDDTR